MKLAARMFLAIAALAACTACAQLQSDSTLPGRFDSHSPEGDAALWGIGGGH